MSCRWIKLCSSALTTGQLMTVLREFNSIHVPLFFFYRLCTLGLIMTPYPARVPTCVEGGSSEVGWHDDERQEQAHHSSFHF